MTAIFGALLLLLSSAMTTDAQVVISQPDLAAGSQLIFYYDAREGFTTFVNIRNSGGEPLNVQLDIWSPTFQAKVVQTFPLAVGGVRVFDIGSLKATAGVGAEVGVAVASVVDASGLPIQMRSLAGNFTVANLVTGSAWGSPALGRSARKVVDGLAPPDGTVVNGSLVVYQIIQPDAVALATYYNPQNLAPVQDHGNQLVFVSFKDGVGAGASLIAATSDWLMIATRGAEGTLSSAPIQVIGVNERDIVQVLGTDANGAPGGGGFVRGAGETANRFIFFVQSLGTFGTGYLLPAL
jgi:hypothetical protein